MRALEKDKLTETLKALADFAAERGDEENVRRVEELAEKLRTETFNLVVFGEFKRGKTTFLNALIGQDLLPSAVVPLTSVVTILHYGSQLEAEIEFLDGRREKITPRRLAEYITERGNPQNKRRVKVARVAVPSPWLANGLQLVDTPGVGSVYDHNTEAAREFLPHVDGAILLVASDPPISRGECEFLLEMQPHVSRLFVVMNKIDLLRPADLAEALAFTESVLSDILRDEHVPIFPLSAREALEAQLEGDPARLEHSGLPAFLAELRRFQEEEQARTLLISVGRNALEVAEDEHLGLALERQASQMSIAEIEQRAAEFRQRRDALLAQREDDTTLIRAAAHRIIAQTLQEDYEEERHKRVPELRERFAAWAAEQRELSGARLIEAGNQFIRETLFEFLGRWRQDEEKRLGEQLAETLQRFTQRANQALAEIYDLAREVFELPPRTVETIGYLAAPSRFRWQDWQWEVRLGLGNALSSWLPGARERILRAIEERLLEEHDKGCGRLRHDFAQRSQAAFEDYVRSVDRSLSEAIAGIDRAIERAITQKQRSTEEAAETAARLAEQEATLQRIREALQAAYHEALSYAPATPAS